MLRWLGGLLVFVLVLVALKVVVAGSVLIAPVVDAIPRGSFESLT